MANELSNPLLQQVETRIEAGLTPENHNDYQKIVVAGMHLALADNGKMLEPLQRARDPIDIAPKAAVGLVLIMRKEAEGKGQVMPEKAMVPAAMTLLLKLLDYIDRSKIAPIGAPELDRATHVFVDFILARLGITKQMLADAAQRVHRLTQDPQAMHAISLKAGTLVHPLAAKPTEVGLINGPA